MPTPSCLASSSSTEISGSRAASSARPPPSGDHAVAARGARTPTSGRTRASGTRDLRAASARPRACGSPSIAARRERTTGISSGAVPPMVGHEPREARRLVGLHVDEEERGRALGRCRARAARAGSTRGARRRRSASRRGRARRGRPAPGCPGGGDWPRLAARRASATAPRLDRATTSRAPRRERQERAGESGEEDPADLPRARLPEREPGEADRDRGEAEPRPPAVQRRARPRAAGSSAGGTRRISSSGQSAKSRVTPTPIARPRRMAAARCRDRRGSARAGSGRAS